MNMLSIRKWLVLSLLAILIIPVLFIRVSAPLLGQAQQGMESGSDQQRSQSLDRAAQQIAGSSGQWSDPEWQRVTREQLTSWGVRAEIRDPDGRMIFQGGPVPHRGGTWGDGWGSWWGPDREIAVMEGGHPLGTMDMFAPNPPGNNLFPAVALAALLGLVVALLGVGWLMGRYVVRPLEATSRAARRIAGGNLDFDLPESRVKEVAEVRAAFEAMGDGLRESIGRQADLEEQRRFFVSAIVHDLRTPLFALRGYLAGLEQGIVTSPEKVARYIAVCRQKSDQLDRLVADLFAYTKTEYLEQTLRSERLDLGLLMERVVDGLRPRAQEKGVEITLVGLPDPCMLEGDAHLLERAVENLLDNALRYTPSGGRIAVRWQVEASRAKFTVTDTGPGIATGDLPHVFDPLYTGDASRNPETGGVGLGLSIARRILRAHGGDLTAANQEGGGAEFTGWIATTSAHDSQVEPTGVGSERRA